ncbi:hypothetical protein APHAL10511_007424 [Amanita phalloides]|nr:hypothetical protein APHAL10511_007424 [Amanita phalloides]
MHRVLPVSRQVAFASGRRVVRVTRRRLATDSAPQQAKKHVLRRILLATVATAGTFYAGSTFVAFNSQTYYDFFSDHVPLGQSMLDYAETHGWDGITVTDVLDASSNVVVAARRIIQRASGALPVEEVKKPEVATRPKMVVRPEEAFKIQTLPPAPLSKPGEQLQPEKEGAQNKKQALSSDVQELANQAEAALAKQVEVSMSSPYPAAQSREENIYDAPLPVGFEPPPGYNRPSRPLPPSRKGDPKEELKRVEPQPEPQPIQLPLITPAVTAMSGDEPIVAQLAGTIDNLAIYVAANPAAALKAAEVLEEAKADLTSLVERIRKAKEEEKAALEAKMDEQTREYSLKLIEIEIEAQDKLDHQEEDFKKLFEEERAKLIDTYRQKLEQELKVQTELINERLKEEVIAQGIELQRRWIREIKVRVEQERGGRLAKLDELSANLKRLEQIAVDNSNILDDNIRIHALWSAVRALTSSALDASERKPFRDELRVLRHIAAAREDELVSTVLEALDASEVPDIGVEPLVDLTVWFTSSVYPKVAQVALVPDQNAGVLSYIASHVLSSFRFKRHGLVDGDDVLSVMARAEYYLNEQDLDSATRELSQLKGPAKLLLRDWLEAARQRLEVQQALDVVQTHATLASLLVV